jgi:hypothetical protein
VKHLRTILAVLALGTPGLALANCECKCIDGEVRAVCSSSIDVKPICSPRICPIVPPSVRPIQSPTVPPIGTEVCEKKQVYNEYTRQYEWKTICR